MSATQNETPTTDTLARQLDVHGAWTLLAPILTHAHDHPDDPEAAVLALRAAVQIQQGVLAREAASRIDPGLAGRADVRALLDRTNELAPMEFGPDDRIVLGRRNVELLHTTRGVDLRERYEQWAAGEHGWRILATPDGNVIRRPAANDDPRSWLWLGEQRAAARSFVAAHFSSAGEEEIAPIAVEGFSPPWVFVEIAGATPRLSNGYQPRIRVLQRDPAEFFEGASIIDLASFVGDDRIAWYVGEDAAERFAAEVRAAPGTQSIGPGVPIGTVRTPIEPPLGELVNTLSAEIVRETNEACERVRIAYEPRDAAWWCERYERALAPGSADPLRVLIPTTRYSTYIQHAAKDLAEAVNRHGHRAELLIEPDDHTRLSAHAYHDAFDRFDPDLVVLINYPRAARAGSFPDNVPFVCWIQDEMPHLFSREVGEAQGPLDFIVGHTARRLFRELGYDASRSLYSPVTVSERKFHAGAITPRQRERFACEVAFVSNHSETPDAMHERKAREAGDPRVRAVLDAIRPGVESVARDLLGSHARRTLKGICRDTLRTLGADESESNSYLMQYACPMLERMVRHNTLAMAADVCDRRGWRLRVFGQGWDEHPRFGAHAGGVIEHGDDLRACYQSATVQIHASALSLVHQRVMECALSGALPIGVLSRSSLPSVARLLYRAGLVPSDADRVLEDGQIAFAIRSHDVLREYVALRERLGLPVANKDEVILRASSLTRLYGETAARGMDAFDAPSLWGDLSDITFRDAASFERLVGRAIEDPAWRADRGTEIARRARAHSTTGGLTDRMLELVRDGIAAAAATPAA